MAGEYNFHQLKPLPVALVFVFCYINLLLFAYKSIYCCLTSSFFVEPRMKQKTVCSRTTTRIVRETVLLGAIHVRAMLSSVY